MEKTTIFKQWIKKLFKPPKKAIKDTWESNIKNYDKWYKFLALSIFSFMLSGTCIMLEFVFPYYQTFFIVGFGIFGLLGAIFSIITKECNYLFNNYCDKCKKHIDGKEYGTCPICGHFTGYNFYP